MIEVRHLTKRFGRTTAVDDLSFDVDKREIVGFLGPNGAGKTTTMRVLSGFLSATGGEARVAGFDVRREPLEVRRRIGYLPESVPLYNDMRVIEYLTYRARLKGLSGSRLRSRRGEVMEQCDLHDVRRRPVGALSKGFRQRVGLADALIADPQVLILDEPTIGLDPNQIRQIRGVIRRLSEHRTILLSSHILSEIEMLCQRVLIIKEGRIVASDTPLALAGLMKGCRRVVVEVEPGERDPREALAAMDGIRRVTGDDSGAWQQLICECEPHVDAREAIFRLAVDQGWAIRELHEERTNLEDVFVAITALDTTEDADTEEGDA